MLFVASFATTFGVFTPSHDLSEPFAALIELFGLLALLVIVCATFASAADDMWRDPGSTFVATLFGFLGFSAILILGTLVPVVVR